LDFFPRFSFDSFFLLFGFGRDIDTSLTIMQEKEPGATIVGVIQLKQKGAKTGLGLDVRHGRIYVDRLGGAFAANPINPIRIGDLLLEVEGTSADEFRGIKEIRKSIEVVFTENKRLNILVHRPDPEDTSDSTDSDYVPETDSEEEEEQTRSFIKIDETYQVRRLVTKKELNGSLVQVVEQDVSNSDRWIVEILEVRNLKDSPMIGEAISVLTEKLSKIIKPDIMMKLRNLKGEEAQYNGCLCTIVECISKEKSNWLVRNPVEYRDNGTMKKHKLKLNVFGKNLEHEQDAAR
jgi:hypothetical protein